MNNFSCLFWIFFSLLLHFSLLLLLELRLLLLCFYLSVSFIFYFTSPGILFFGTNIKRYSVQLRTNAKKKHVNKQNTWICINRNMHTHTHTPAKKKWGREWGGDEKGKKMWAMIVKTERRWGRVFTGYVQHWERKKKIGVNSFNRSLAPSIETNAECMSKRIVGKCDARAESGRGRGRKNHKENITNAHTHTYRILSYFYSTVRTPDLHLKNVAAFSEINLSFFARACVCMWFIDQR